jgi:ATP-dependent helicase IRC3
MSVVAMKAPTLRPYQLDAGKALEACFFDQDRNRILIKKPTGTGKTVWFASLLKEFDRLRAWLETLKAEKRHKGAIMLVIAHREELLDQAAEKIQRQNPGLMVSIEQGDRHANSYSDVVIASIQTLAAMKFRRLKRLLQRHTFRLVIVDEAHHAAAASYRTALVHLGFLPAADASESSEIEAITHDDIAVMTDALQGWDAIAPRDRLLVGVTATPNRSDAIGLGCVFQTIGYSYGLKEAIDDGYLVPITPWVIETSTNLDSVRTSHGDFNQRELADAVNNDRRNKLAVNGWHELAIGMSTIAFTVDVAHAHALAEEFTRAGVVARAVSGETHKEERRQILKDYSRGEVQVITNCMVLTEGTDLPLTECILHCKPTKSATLYEQMTGRGLRVHPDDPAGPARLEMLQRANPRMVKRQCVVIDVVDIARRHSLQAAPTLYGLPPGINANGKPLDEVLEWLEKMREELPGFNVEEQLQNGMLTLEQLNAKASTFDIWKVQSLGAFGNGRALDWMKTGDDLYQLRYPWQDGNEILKVQRDMLGHFEVTLTLRPADNGPTRQRTLVTGLETSDQAAGMAEQFVFRERRAVTKIADKDAPWKARPASPKQTAALQRMRVPFKPGITMGEASKLLDLAIARRPARR